VNDILSWILATVSSVDPVVRTLLAGVGILLETSVLVGLIVPGDTIVIVASTGVQNVFEYVALVVAVIVGALAGESLGFALGRYFGPWIRASTVGRKLGERHWVEAENYLRRRGGLAVFLSRFIPVLHSLIPLTVGMSSMRYRRFMAWTVPACVIWSVTYVSVGSAAAGGYRELSQQLHFAGYLFVGVIALFVVLVFAVKKWLSHREARHMEQDAPAAAVTDSATGGVAMDASPDTTESPVEPPETPRAPLD
jgi:membrane protein DedA with SNARE-associated domain